MVAVVSYSVVLFCFGGHTVLCTVPMPVFEYGNVKTYLNLSKQTLVVTGLVSVEVLPGHTFYWNFGMLVLIKFPYAPS